MGQNDKSKIYPITLNEILQSRTKESIWNLGISEQCNLILLSLHVLFSSL